MKTTMTSMTREQRRLIENMRATALDFSTAARARDEFSGGMRWLPVKGKEYLARYRRDPVTGQQLTTSLGGRSVQTEAMYDHFIAERSDLDKQMSDLKPEMSEQARLAKALRLNRAPEDVGAVLRAVGMSDLTDHLALSGDAAVFAHENEMAFLLPRELLPDGDIEFVLAGLDASEAVDELTGVLRRARIDLRGSTRQDAGWVELRTEEGLRIRLVALPAIERMADIYADEDYGGGEAARWAVEQSPVVSLVVDRQGRASTIRALEPRAWCILRCMTIDMDEMSIIRREASAELVSAMIRITQERWTSPFEPDHVETCRHLHEALEGEEFLPPPRI